MHSHGRDRIVIQDMEVHYRVGVFDAERVRPQRLLLTVEMEHDFAAAAEEDCLAKTIDYQAVCHRLQRFGRGAEWFLIEALASDIAEMILAEFRPQSVTVEVKKFIIPRTRWVSVSLTRPK